MLTGYRLPPKLKGINMDEATLEVTIDVGDWARFPEVLNYAQSHGITAAEAIIDLTNEGLSHQPRTYV